MKKACSAPCELTRVKNHAGVAQGKVISHPTYERNLRISDLAVPVAQMYGMTLRTTTVGTSPQLWRNTISF